MSGEVVVDPVRLEVRDGVGVLRLDRPKLNAIDRTMQQALAHAARACDERDDIAALVITGGPEVFAAGADVKQLATMSAADMAEYSGELQSTFTALATIGKPVVAAINGYALGGGCELALCADVRFAADDAVLGQPEVKLGLIPGAGGTQRLTRLLGPARAKNLILTGRQVPADEALHLGLVDQVLPAAEVLPTALDWARQFVGSPPLALRAAKACVDAAFTADGFEVERQSFAELFESEDHTIGLTAFLNRSAPTFTGR